MTGLRIVDNDGAVWPVTGSRCTVCRLPRDPAVDDRIHPGCRPAQLIPDASLNRLIDHLTLHLGAAVEVSNNPATEEIGMTQPRPSNREEQPR